MAACRRRRSGDAPARPFHLVGHDSPSSPLDAERNEQCSVNISAVIGMQEAMKKIRKKSGHVKCVQLQFRTFWMHAIGVVASSRPLVSDDKTTGHDSPAENDSLRVGIQCGALGYLRWGRPVFLSFAYGQTV